MYPAHETIAAVSTPPGVGGIGIIRISGPQAFALLPKLFPTRIERWHNVSELKDRRMVLAHLLDAEGQVIDNVLVTLMPPEKSFTGEQTLEINCHGGKKILENALARVLQAGAKAARPGEFTRQAVGNGRFDLVQASAINDLIRADTDFAAKNARKILDGGFSNTCRELRNSLVQTQSSLIACIEYGEGRQEEVDRVIDELEITKNKINEIYKKAKYGVRLSEGFLIVFYGPVNSGKSTIFNKILNFERSITNEEPGTTRDPISEKLEINGIPIRLVDTAGYKPGFLSSIEEMAFSKSKLHKDSADIILFVIDSSSELSQETFNEAMEICIDKGICIFNKMDLTCSKSAIELASQKIKKIWTSMHCESTINDLKNEISRFLKERTGIENESINIEAYKYFIDKTRSHIFHSLQRLHDGKMDLADEELNMAIENIKILTGEVWKEEAWEHVFNTFCLGK